MDLEDQTQKILIKSKLFQKFFIIKKNLILDF